MVKTEITIWFKQFTVKQFNEILVSNVFIKCQVGLGGWFSA